MPRRLFDLYQRKRIVNVNANIVASGLLAIAIAKYPVHVVGDLIGADRKVLVTLAAGGIDMVVDVALYYALHWLANHWNPPWKRTKREKPKKSFFHDATLVQFERALLSPLYYIVAMGLMLLLQFGGLAHSWAFLIGFSVGILVTRVVHTCWGLRTGRFLDLPCSERAAIDSRAVVADPTQPPADHRT